MKFSEMLTFQRIHGMAVDDKGLLSPDDLGDIIHWLREHKAETQALIGHFEAVRLRAVAQQLGQSLREMTRNEEV